MPHKPNTLLQNILLLVVSLAFFAVIAEFVLRAALPNLIIWKDPQESYQYDKTIGHWLVPNQKSFTHDKNVITNSEGLRDREYGSNAPAHTIRILSLGDSQTFGNGLDLGATWPKQLEKILNISDSKSSYEVINAGLAGSDTWQHEVILERLLPKYNPDIIVLAFYVNDVVRKFTPSPEMKKKQESHQNRLVYTLKKSALLLSLRTAVGAVKNMINPSDGFLLQQALLKGEDNPVLNGRWKQVSESIASMKRMSDIYHAKFMIFVLPRRDQVDGRMPWSAYYGKLSLIAKQSKVPVISMLEPLQAAYKEYGKKLFIPWDGHNTEIANHVIAETLSHKLLPSQE